MSCPVILSRAGRAYIFASVKTSFLCLCLYSPGRADCLCSRQALHLSMLCISFVYLLKKPNRKHKNNLFTTWERNDSRHPLKMVWGFFPTCCLIGWNVSVTKSRIQLTDGNVTSTSSEIYTFYRESRGKDLDLQFLHIRFFLASDRFYRH